MLQVGAIGIEEEEEEEEIWKVFGWPPVVCYPY
jgi:hypothetical protein